MFQGKKIGAILLMGGEGSRFASKTPKQFCLLNHLPVYQHTLKILKESQLFDEIVLVSHKNWIEKLPNSVTIAIGGNTRQLSSYQGLHAFTEKPDIVLIHDAVRPFITAEILKNNLSQAIIHGAADTCIASTDTLIHSLDGKMIDQIPNRSHFMRGQTPQTFRYEWIVQAHEQALADGIKNATDDCQLVLRIGKQVSIVPGDEKNFKITTALDLIIAEQLLARHT